jgi:hypothetical protein
MSVGRDFDRELARCEREIREIAERQGPDRAYLTVMGMSDWEHERRLIERERAAPSSQIPWLDIVVIGIVLGLLLAVWVFGGALPMGAPMTFEVEP